MGANVRVSPLPSNRSRDMFRESPRNRSELMRCDQRSVVSDDSFSRAKSNISGLELIPSITTLRRGCARRGAPGSPVSDSGCRGSAWTMPRASSSGATAPESAATTPESAAATSESAERDAGSVTSSESSSSERPSRSASASGSSSTSSRSFASKVWFSVIRRRFSTCELLTGKPGIERSESDASTAGE